MYHHVLSSPEGYIALTLHFESQDSELSRILTWYEERKLLTYWGYLGSEMYLEVSTKLISEDDSLFDGLTAYLNWNAASYVIRKVEQYRQANRGTDVECTLRCALSDLQEAAALLYLYRS